MILPSLPKCAPGFRREARIWLLPNTSCRRTRRSPTTLSFTLNRRRKNLRRHSCRGIAFRSARPTTWSNWERRAARSIGAWTRCFAGQRRSPSMRGSSAIRVIPRKRPRKRPQWPWRRRARSLIRCCGVCRPMFSRSSPFCCQFRLAISLVFGGRRPVEARNPRAWPWLPAPGSPSPTAAPF